MKKLRRDQWLFLGILVLFLGAFSLFICWNLVNHRAVFVNFQSLSEELEGQTFLQQENILTGSEQKLKKDYGLYRSDYAQVLYYTQDSTMNVFEILIVEQDSDGDLSTVKAAMEKHKDRLLKTFEHYGTNQYDLLNHSIIYENDRYIYYVCSEHAEEISAFLQERMEQ